MFLQSNLILAQLLVVRYDDTEGLVLLRDSDGLCVVHVAVFHTYHAVELNREVVLAVQLLVNDL